jgi:hypothetical protein
LRQGRLGAGRAVGCGDTGAVDDDAALDFERRGAGEPAFAGRRTIEHGFSAFWKRSRGTAKDCLDFADSKQIFQDDAMPTGHEATRSAVQEEMRRLSPDDQNLSVDLF